MISVQILGYFYEAVTTFETPAKRTLHKFVMKVHANKEVYFVDVFVSEFQIEYLKNASVGMPILVYGELQVSSYNAKDGVPKSKLSIYAKGMKLVREGTQTQEKPVAMQEFLW